VKCYLCPFPYVPQSRLQQVGHLLSAYRCDGAHCGRRRNRRDCSVHSHQYRTTSSASSVSGALVSPPASSTDGFRRPVRLCQNGDRDPEC
jgi:hypothetical protein